jgi:peptidyl-prolyl cis-trans isomerase B (cyclophilin B)
MRFTLPRARESSHTGGTLRRIRWRSGAPLGHNDASTPVFHLKEDSSVKARPATIALVALLAALLLPAPGLIVPGSAQQPTQPAPAAPKGAPAAKDAPTGGKKVKQTAVITMEKGGEINIEFFPEDAPKTVENFVTLAKKGFYDGLAFHRVEPNFVVQGGDPKGNGTGGPGYTIKDEFNKQKHVRGVVAMARTQAPNSAGSQFYITLAPAHFLDGQYTVFGRVTSGMEVVDKIRVGDKMKSVKILEVAQ